MHSYKSFSKIYKIDDHSKIQKWFWIPLVLIVGGLFLPWTQNIRSTGSISTLYQNQRPQELHSPIPGRIVKWYVKNGDQVKLGDTLLQISEIKDDYLDPLLVERTEQQVRAKQSMREFYDAKIEAANSQAQAVRAGTELKISQLKNKSAQLQSKLKAEQAELKAAQSEYQLAQNQLERQQKMYDEGLVSLTNFQQRMQAFQNIAAKRSVIENKIAQTQQELANVSIEQNAVIQDLNEKMSKIESDKFSSMSSVASSESDIAKLQNQVATYRVRQGMYYVIATQNGQISNIMKAGIGEVLKDGEKIGTIVPDEAVFTVEMNIKPVDLPLVKKGQRVIFTFDGYPAIVFSGWPHANYGVFKGRVLAVSNYIDANGYFKAIVVEDDEKKKWPKNLRVGTAAQGIAILNDVPVWYEIWRNINGFPPDYYEVKPENKDAK